jgi:hypothetical protein
MSLIKRKPQKPIDALRVYELARMGTGVEMMARSLGITSTTLRSRMKIDPRVREGFNRGRSEYAAEFQAGRRGPVKNEQGQLMIVTTSQRERVAIKANPQEAIFNFIRLHPGATYYDMRRHLGLSEDTITDNLAVLSLDKRSIKGRRREGEELSRFYPIEEERKPSLAA